MSGPLIEVHRLKKAFHGRPVLRGIDLQVPARQLTVLIGASGSGKSTLLRCLNGLEVFDEGRISLNGITLERHGAHRLVSREFHQHTHELRLLVGMVFQQFNLFPHMTTLDNVARPPMIVKQMARDEAYAHAEALLEKVGLHEHVHHYPQQLSGGQQQRAAIARALAMKPRVILYDEPTSALDPGLVDEVLQVMKGLDAEGITQVVVTHEMRFARDVADKVVLLADGEIVEEGEPDVIFTEPRDPRTRQFLRRFL